jgi:hypothetical protein
MTKNFAKLQEFWSTGKYTLQGNKVILNGSKILKEDERGRIRLCKGHSQMTTTVNSIRSMLNGQTIQRHIEGIPSNFDLDFVYRQKNKGVSIGKISQMIYKDEDNQNKTNNLHYHYTSRKNRLIKLLMTKVEYIDTFSTGIHKGFKIYDCKELDATLIIHEERIILIPDEKINGGDKAKDMSVFELFHKYFGIKTY